MELGHQPQRRRAGDTSYTPQNKQAQTVMTQWFGQSSSPNSPPSGTINMSTGNQTVSSGANVQIPITLTNSGAALTNAVVDIEVYNQSNQQVFQKFYPGVTLAANSNQTFAASWIAGSNGTYTVKGGVFNSNWSQNYYWQNAAGIINVGSGNLAPTPTPNPTVSLTPTPAQNQTIDVWWPTNGVTVSGIQPFKAMLYNADVSTYNMYWQVDNGQLNAMANNSQDWPHKEAEVDLSGWNWNQNNQYQLNFIAKDLNGNILTEQPVKITVTR